MKTNKLLKILSAATIISTITVVENTTQSNTTFAIENNAVAAKDVKNLPDGEYNITAEAFHFSPVHPPVLPLLQLEYRFSWNT